MQIGRRIYFEKSTGSIIWDTGERSGQVKETTIEDDFLSYSKLIGINPDITGVTQLNYRQHAEEFATCTSYRVSPETGEIIFTFEPAEPEPEETNA